MIVFPWRHKVLPLPRLIHGTPEHAKQGLLLTSKSQRVYGNSSLNAIVTAYMFLNVPWYELFWISHFRDELSSDISWSFTQGVACLLSNLRSFGGGDHIATDRIITEHNDGTCSIDFSETLEISRNAESGVCHNSAVNSDVEVVIEDGDDKSGYNNAILPRQIFEEKVVELYQSSVEKVSKIENDDSKSLAEEKQQLEVRLKMKPYHAEFITLYAIPYLSRRNSKSDPQLLDFYSEMLNSPSRGRAAYLSHLRQEHLENKGYMESTIIAQCLIWCDEEFYVKDLATGKILQGREAEKESSSDAQKMQQTPHLVRMERTVVTKRDPNTGNFENDQENWIITDIDDLLGGNLLV